MPPAAPSTADRPRQPPTHLLYLHGFRSSPRSFKAQRLRAWLQAHRPDLHWWCPQLPPSPREAMALVMQGIAGWPHERMAVLGSSLGGFYATWVAERLGCPAVLLNPAVDPARDLAAYIGEQTAFHTPEERFFFRAGYVDELQALQAGPIKQPQRYLLVAAKGDEVLDWREMVARYPGVHLHLLEGGDHALSDFDDHLPLIIDFLSMTPRP
ncbi:MAG: esterase [Rubrivivax sp.]|nr:esterase [Rubrivivax sp.]